MARTGLYKSEVKKARDTLLGQGKHPSVDAVRIELGNTGSKTTIHKYLKELEEEDGGSSPKIVISEALQDLVGRLAAQLQAEADGRIEVIRADAAETEQRQAAEIQSLRDANRALEGQLEQTRGALQEETQAHKVTQAQLREQVMAVQKAELQLDALHARFGENEQHRKSLEEKHAHAREALEHFRNAAKEQRDQDHRRHEQQVQTLQMEIRQLRQDLIVKQDEVTRVNLEGARLSGELSHVQKSLYDAQAHNRQTEQKLEQLHALETGNALLVKQVEEKEQLLEKSTGQVSALRVQLDEVNANYLQCQADIVALQAKFDANQSLATEIRSLLEQNAVPQS